VDSPSLIVLLELIPSTMSLVTLARSFESATAHNLGLSIAKVQTSSSTFEREYGLVSQSGRLSLADQTNEPDKDSLRRSPE
jgi:hypothetical protein